MALIYADTSAIVRGYLADEGSDDGLAELLFDGDQPVVTSELARVEYASALAAAVRTGRLSDAGPVLDQFDYDCAEDGPIALLRLRPAVTMPAAQRLLFEVGPLRTLDAIHLAVAQHDAAELAGDGRVMLLTRDERQAAAARAIGLEVR